MATGAGNLPNPGMSFSPFAILTAEEMNDLVANIESLATGTGFGDGAMPRLRATRYYTSSTTWTKPAAMASNGFIIAKALGGGGGGAGSGTNVSKGGGGGGGGLAIKTILASSLGSTVAVTIGTAGTGGASGNNAGVNGGDTTFGSFITGGGGTGGQPPSGSFNSSSGGTATGGDLNISGGNGGVRRGATSTGTSPGGHAPMGFGYAAPADVFTSDIGALNASGYGAGGNGALRTSTSAAGGAGTAGLVIVEEYY